MTKRTAILVLAIVSISFASDAGAQTAPEPPSDKIVLDGRSYDKKQIAKAFMDVVFTTEILQNINDLQGFRFSSFAGRDSSITNETTIKDGYPWLYPYLYPKKLARVFAINKWQKPIKISFGLPNDLRSYSKDTKYDALFSLPDTNLTKEISAQDEIINVLEDEVKASVQKLAEHVNVPVSYVSKEQENKDNIGNVRIVLTPKGHFTDKFRDHVGGRMTLGARYFIPQDFRYHVEPFLASSAVFSGEAKKHVEGYFLMDEQNEIGFAVCYISIEHPPELLKAMVNECLIRSLGLPGILRLIPSTQIKAMPESYLDLWNEPEIWKNNYSNYELPYPKSFSEFDLHLLSLLYDPKIKPGMDYVELRGILNN